jgi:hypothetical protein
MVWGVLQGSCVASVRDMGGRGAFPLRKWSLGEGHLVVGSSAFRGAWCPSCGIPGGSDEKGLLWTTGLAMNSSQGSWLTVGSLSHLLSLNSHLVTPSLEAEQMGLIHPGFSVPRLWVRYLFLYIIQSQVFCSSKNRLIGQLKHHKIFLIFIAVTQHRSLMVGSELLYFQARWMG